MGTNRWDTLYIGIGMMMIFLHKYLLFREECILREGVIFEKRSVFWCACAHEKVINGELVN